MRPSFQSRLLNGPFGDPCVRVDLVGLGTSVLFDLGWLEPPGPGNVGTVRYAFVSHTHIDHFIGFDPLIRSLLPLERILTVVGPEGILDNIAGKLHGYTWNLVTDYLLEIEVVEVSADSLRSTRFRCRNGLAPEPFWTRPFQGAVVTEPAFTVDAVALDHQVPSLAFLLREPFHLSVNKVKLGEMNLCTGSWLQVLKWYLYTDAAPETTVHIPASSTLDGMERRLTVDELTEAAVRRTRGHRVGYVVDCLFSDANRARIVDLVREADVLYCEAAFVQADEDRARATGHLTATQAAMLAREAGVKRLHVFHYSKRYLERGPDPGREAEEVFNGRFT